MFEDKIKQLKGKENVQFHEPLTKAEVLNKLECNSICLPDAHISLLMVTDGLECFGGYFRIFGLNENKNINLQSWNSKDLWKFSWGNRLEYFLCFGETAWGDQYAYRIDKKGKIIPNEIYFIEGITMTAEVIFNDFETFFINELLRNADKPYDEIIINVRNKVGDLSIDEHITYMPSILIGGEEDPDNVQKIDGVTSMIINGDLCMQLANELQERPVKELRPYVDENGRNRIEVVWLSH